jgi:hypothetical protein
MTRDQKDWILGWTVIAVFLLFCIAFAWMTSAPISTSSNRAEHNAAVQIQRQQ